MMWFVPAAVSLAEDHLCTGKEDAPNEKEWDENESKSAKRW
jgi:hypothetical protein